MNRFTGGYLKAKSGVGSLRYLVVLAEFTLPGNAYEEVDSSLGRILIT
jgi:hypothetical protein